MTTKSALAQAAAVLLLGVALGSADAAVQGTITLMRDPSIGIPFTAPDEALPAPWVSYSLALHTTAGEQIGGVDFTINGQFHQRWTFDEDAGAFLPTANVGNIGNGDSHLRTAAGALFASGPSENNSGSGSPLPDSPTSDYGTGTTLSGAWGLPGGPMSTNLAYIVIPKGTESALNLSAVVANPMGDIIADLGWFGFQQVLPNAQVTGNGNIITNGDTTPSLLDLTDFGEVEVGSFTQRTFTISNTGTVPMSLGPAMLTGPYSLLGPLPGTINPGSSANFSVRLDTTTPGFFPGSISFASNAFLNDPFNFSLAAQVVPEPASGALLMFALIAGISSVRRCGRENS